MRPSSALEALPLLHVQQAEGDKGQKGGAMEIQSLVVAWLWREQGAAWD